MKHHHTSVLVNKIFATTLSNNLKHRDSDSLLDGIRLKRECDTMKILKKTPTLKVKGLMFALI